MANKSRIGLDQERTPLPVAADDFTLEQVRLAIHGIRYGEVRVIIQDGVIVQIESVEKRRLR